MDLLTEVHAVDYMQESMNGIMRVGLLSKPLHNYSQPPMPSFAGCAL